METSGSCSEEVLKKKSWYSKLVSCLSHCICVQVTVNNAELGQKGAGKSSFDLPVFPEQEPPILSSWSAKKEKLKPRLALSNTPNRPAVACDQVSVKELL